jgi:hypothetical protein
VAGRALGWRPKDRHVAVGDDDEKLLGAAGLVVAAVQYGERQPIPVVGIAIAAAPYRRRRDRPQTPGCVPITQPLVLATEVVGSEQPGV